MDEKQVARYLGMDLREIRKLASRDKLPGRRVGEEYRFTKGEIDHWVWEQMHRFDRETLASIEKGVARHHGLPVEQPVVCPCIPEQGVAVPLHAKTRESTLRSLAELADSCGLVYDKDFLLEQVRQREDLCATALLPQVAMPHPRAPMPYEIAESFVVVGLTDQGIPYGAEDGSLTRLFFLVCCKDERTHLHILARLVRMLDDSELVEELLHCRSADELEEKLARREMQLLQHRG
jgi:PTS system nitrogen regulatory IIA component